MNRILLMALTAASLLAADATGRWAGNLLVPGEGGGEQSSPALLILRQEGMSLSGTAGPDDGERHPISNGKAENGVLTFEISTGGGVMKFQLKQEGEEIRGEISRERGGQTQKAKLALKREK